MNVNPAEVAWLAGLRRFLDEIERDCSPLAGDPENSIDYNEGVCDERGRIAGILDSLLSPLAALPDDGREGLREAISVLENYGDHHEWCARGDGAAEACTCGLWDELEKLRAALDREARR